MSKRLHPIYKLQRAMNNRLAVGDIGTSKERALILKHVKPLLDKIDKDHDEDAHDGPGPGGEEDGTFERPDWCEACRILAAWKEPL